MIAFGLEKVLLICMFGFGLSWIIADSKISLIPRHWVVSKTGPDSLLIQFLECPPCLSFWIGLGAGFLLYHSVTVALALAPICTAFSILSWSFVNKE